VSTDSTVPAAGFDTAAVASSSARRSADRSAAPLTVRAPSQLSASPRSTCERITPELPRAPATAPFARADTAAPTASAGSRTRASSADRMVCSRLVPVSPSATGNTLIRSIASRSASRARTTAAAHRRTASASSA